MVIKMETIKGTTEAIEDFNVWESKAVIMFDYDSNEVWTDCFISDNSSNCYYSKSIIPIWYKDSLYDRFNTIDDVILAKMLYVALQYKDRFLKVDKGSHEEFILYNEYTFKQAGIYHEYR